MLSYFKNCPNLKIAKKCCFCVPVRKGVIIFGYVNLVLNLLSFPLLVYMLVEEIAGKKKTLDKSYEMFPYIHLPMTIGFVVLDVAMTIVLIVGAHKKKERLLKSYLYFGIVFQILMLCVDLVYFDYREYIENTLYFLFFGLNIYLLYLVYCLMKKVEHSSEVQYVSYQDHQRTL